MNVSDLILVGVSALCGITRFIVRGCKEFWSS